MECFLLGVDLGGTTAKLGLFDETGGLLARSALPTDTTDSGRNILPDIAAALPEFLRGVGASPAAVRCGMGVPGVVTGRRYVERCPNLGGWGELDVAAELLRLTGMPFAVANDADAAALGEAWRGSAAGNQNVVLLTLGTGIGGGVLLSGRLLEGTHGSAGEIGHIKVRQDEPLACGCGSHGCLEQYAAAPGIVRRMRQALAQSDAPCVLRALPEFTAKDVFDGAAAGDALCRTQAVETADLLGMAIANLTAVLDPEAVLLGGGVSAAGELLRAAVEKAYRKYAYPAMRETSIRLAALGGDAGLYGAAKLALDSATS